MKLIDTFEPVQMPEKGCIYNNKGYVYHLGKGYRNSKGQPTCDQTSIGKLDSKTGMLIPNKMYFEIYDVEPKMKVANIDEIRTFGDYCFFEFIIRDLKIDHVLKNIFGNLGEDLLLIAIYMVLHGNQLYHCEQWCEETLNVLSKVITSQRCSRILSGIDEKKKMDFFRAWVYAREQEEYLVYDVTSISSYSKGIEDVEYGYNRDKEPLPQINLGMYYGAESRLPIYYCIYNGSINDKSHLETMMTDNERLGIRKLKFVEDRGFFTKENVQFMVGKGYTFICAMYSSQKIPQNLIDTYCDKVNSHRNSIGSTGIRGIAIENTDYGFRCNIHIFYNLKSRCFYNIQP